MQKMLERLLELGLYGLLIYTPLAYGGVTPLSITIEGWWIGLLCGIWIIKILANRVGDEHSGYHAHGQGQHHAEKLSFVSRAFLLVILAYVGLILAQMMPLPLPVVKLLSPTGYRLYAEGAAITQTPLPAFLPLSTCVQATLAEWLKLLSYLAIFFLTVNTIHSSRQIKRVLSVILVIGFFEAFYGILQFVSGQHVEAARKASVWVRGTFINKNHFAGYLELVIPLAFGLLFSRSGQHDRSGYKSPTLEEKYMKGLFVAFSVCLLIAALFLSGSRGGMISLAAGLCCFSLLAAMRRLFRPWIVVMLIVLSFGVGLLVMSNPKMLYSRIQKLAHLESESSALIRWELWRSAIHIFRDYPVLGAGLGTFTHLNRQYKTFVSRLHFNYPENDYVQLLAETGLIGTGMAAAAGGLFIYHLLIAWRRQESYRLVAIASGGMSALCSIAVHSLMDFNLHIPSNAILVSVIAAICYVAARTQKTSHSRHTENEAEVRSPSRHTHRRAQPPQHSKKRAIFAGGILALMAVGWYLFAVGRSYSALAHYQQASALLTSAQQVPLTVSVHNRILEHFRLAVQHEPGNAQYVAALGKYLYQMTGNLSQDAAKKNQQAQMAEAEQWLRRAVRFDPANPWYYYELGLFSYQQQDCRDWKRLHPATPWEQCTVSQYLLAALQRAPQEPFLRQAVGQWYAAGDYDAAVRLMQAFVAHDLQQPVIEPTPLNAFARTLYNLRMDYESDLIVAHIMQQTEPPPATCQPTMLTHNPGSRYVEFGNDDGSAEWNTPLTAETIRIKKEICLPEQLETYDAATLKIFLNYTGRSGNSLQMWLDDHPIALASGSLPQTVQWYNIPIPKRWLEGKRKITVYLRVKGTVVTGSLGQIWGDQHTPTTSSTLNWNVTSDLSPASGVQTGEYLIRLMLTKASTNL